MGWQRCHKPYNTNLARRISNQ